MNIKPYHKLFLLLLLNTASALDSYSQYSLSIDTSSVYVEITNPTYEIPDHSQAFGNINTKPDMFFKAFSQQYDLHDNVYIPIKQGYCYFDNGVRSTTIYGCDGSYTKRPGQTSVFSFKTDTATGNRKFIMQWKNMGLENGHDSDYLNFQIWLYEKDGSIEIRFGDNKVRPGLFNNNANGPTIGLLEMDDAFSTIFNQIWLKGNPSVPQVVNTNSIITLDRVPKAGTIYRFVNESTSIANHFQPGFNVNLYPNPVTDLLNIEFYDSKADCVELYSSTGELLKKEQKNTDNMTLDISSFPSGVYIIAFKNELNGLTGTKKIIKF